MLGKIITEVLSSSATISAAVGDNITAVAGYFTEQNTLPCIYYIVKCKPQYVKNGTITGDWSASLLVISNNYPSSWELTTAIIDAFSSIRGNTVAGYRILHSEVLEAKDDYEFQINGYTQRIELNIKYA